MDIYMATRENPDMEIIYRVARKVAESLIYKWRTLGALPKNERPNACI